MEEEKESSKYFLYLLAFEMSCHFHWEDVDQRVKSEHLLTLKGGKRWMLNAKKQILAFIRCRRQDVKLN